MDQAIRRPPERLHGPHHPSRGTSKVALDRFHRMKLVDGAQDAVRHSASPSMSGRAFRTLSQGLRNPGVSNTPQKARFTQRKAMNLQAVQACHMKLLLRDFLLNSPIATQARSYLQRVHHGPDPWDPAAQVPGCHAPTAPERPSELLAQPDQRQAHRAHPKPHPDGHRQGQRLPESPEPHLQGQQTRPH